MGMDTDKKTYTQIEIENIMSNSFTAGICYGASMAILQDKYPNETVMDVARALMDGAMPGFRQKAKHV